MTPYTPHSLWSASKSILASILAPQLFERAIDERAPVTTYISELAHSGFAGATVRQLLDMYTGIEAPCFPSQRELGINDAEAMKPWTSGSPEFRSADNEFSRCCRAAGVFSSLPNERLTGYYDFLLTVECDGGKVGSGKVIAGIEDFVADVRRNPGLERWTEQTNAREWSPDKTGYRSQMWTTPAERSRESILYAHGAYHQKCCIDAERKVVLVKYSSFEGMKPGRPVED